MADVVSRQSERRKETSMQGEFQMKLNYKLVFSKLSYAYLISIHSKKNPTKHVFILDMLEQS